MLKQAFVFPDHLGTFPVTARDLALFVCDWIIVCGAERVFLFI